MLSTFDIACYSIMVVCLPFHIWNMVTPPRFSPNSRIAVLF